MSPQNASQTNNQLFNFKHESQKRNQLLQKSCCSAHVAFGDIAPNSEVELLRFTLSTPIPEPAGIGLITLGGLSLFAWRQRRTTEGHTVTLDLDAAV